MVVSNTKVFVGDAKGSIDIVELIPNEEEKLELHFGTQAGGMEISRVKKRRVLSSSKHPVTCLAFVESLAYLVSGHSNG